MISRLRGVLLSRGEERVEVLTPGGVVYEVEVPLSVAQRLPPVGGEVELRTVHVVREDLESLFGFLEPEERVLFQRLLGASGVGGRLALDMLSTYPATRLVRVLTEKDVAALVQIPGVRKKTAERLALELADRLSDLRMERSAADASVEGAQAAVHALMALGMSHQQADSAVRAVLDEGDIVDTPELIRKALARQ